MTTHTHRADNMLRQQAAAARKESKVMKKLIAEISAQKRDVEITQVHDDISFNGKDALWAADRLAALWEE